MIEHEQRIILLICIQCDKEKSRIGRQRWLPEKVGLMKTNGKGINVYAREWKNDD